MKEHSEEYMKGYHCGYEVARQNFERKLSKNKPDMRRLVNISSIPPLIEWLHIENDDTSVFCSNCHTSFEWYEPFKFCPECGGRSQFADMRGEE